MNKPFLLTAGHFYYPRSGDSNWISCFETQELIEDQITIDDNQYYGDGKFIINGIRYDWYKIIDLREWTQ